MKILNLKPRIFRKSPEIKTHFTVGAFNFSLAPRKAVIPERRRVLKTLGTQAEQIATLSQVHSKKLVHVTPQSKINFLSREILEADGMYTEFSNIYLEIRSADCLPILFYNISAGVIGAVHAGWRGTKKQILKKVVREVVKEFAAPFNDFYFYLGPAAQSCCYEVTKYSHDKNFFDFFQKDITRRGGKLYLDYVNTNLCQLKELGIKDKQIENFGICTIHNQIYPSHRRQKDARKETLLSFIGMIDKL